MKDYISTCPVSQPVYLPGLKADAELGGLKFSYQYGMFYIPTGKILPIQLPPPLT